MNAQGLGTMVRIDLRTGWKVIAAWALGIVAMMVLTATSLVALYPDARSLQGYAASLGDSMVMLNGRIAGLDTLGGVLANEFAVVTGFGLPLMAIAVTSRATRKDEEAGRVELLLAARIGRHAPVLAAVVVVLASLLVTGAGVAAAMIAVGVAAATALLYAAAAVGLGLVFAGVAALTAQIFEHNRAVWASSLAVALVSFLLRGWASVEEHPVVWASPHGWVDLVRAAGDDPRPWVLALPLLTSMVLLAVAVWLATRRDVGAALVRGRAASSRASAWLRSPLGLAWYGHRGPIIGWTIGTAALMGMYGSLTREVVDAVRDNTALGDMVGADAALADEIFLPQILSMFLLMLGLLVASYVVMALGSLRGEEDSGRLESELSGTRGRRSWLGTHLLVVAVGAAVIWAAGAISMGATVASATGDDAWFGRIVEGALPYLVTSAAFVGIAVALLGLRPRWQMLGWVVFALAALVAYLGPGFDLPGWLVKASIFPAVGDNLLGDGASTVGVSVVAALAAALIVVGVVGFTRRDIPTG